MNKKALEKFAPRERVNLRGAVEKRLIRLGLDANTLPAFNIWFTQTGGTITVNGQVYLDYTKQDFEALYYERNRVGYEQLVEELAYTWFNRLMAIRYMEVKGILPDYVKIIEHDAIARQPEIMNNYGHLVVERAEIEDLKLRNEDESAYRKLFLASVNKLGEVMPFLFEPLKDWTELVLPDKMLEPGGIIERILKEEGLTESFENGVEAIGWLYQYYIAEVKANIMELKKVNKEYVPARTQIFTPNWIVRYMVDNSLGQLWLDANPDSEIAHSMQYKIEEPEQTSEAKKVIDEIRSKTVDIETITLLDPAMGSGHILSYAYDVFYQMYLEKGYSKRDIPTLILQNNLYGIDLDKRATQLAAFTLTMKAVESGGRSYWRKVVIPHCVEIQESNGIDLALVELVFTNEQLDIVKVLIKEYLSAKEYGSLLTPQKLDIEKLEESFRVVTEDTVHQISFFNASDSLAMDTDGQMYLIGQLMRQHKLLTNEFDVVVANPPYMGSSAMSNSLSDYAKKHYPNTKSDLFAMFIERIFAFTKEDGFSVNVTMQSWMFLSSFKNMRSEMLDKYGITTLLHMGNNVMGIAFGTVAAVFRKKLQDYNGRYMFVKVEDINNDIPRVFPVLNERYISKSVRGFSTIPGSPISYWVPEEITRTFESNSIVSEHTISDGQNKTGNNDLYMRFHWEVAQNSIISSKEDIEKKKWLPLSKGGPYRRWYGNQIDIIDWSNKARQHYRKDKIGRIIPEYLWFKKGITWGRITNKKPSFRVLEEVGTFDTTGSSIFLKDDKDFNFLLGLLNSKISEYYFEFLNPSVALQVGDVQKIPFVTDFENKDMLNNLVSENIEICKKDWDYLEKSADYKQNILINQKNKHLKEAFENYKDMNLLSIKKLKNNEERINEILFKAYKLSDSLTVSVDDSDISIEPVKESRAVKDLLSYFIGCTLGRYSLDIVGLAYAGGAWDESKYLSYRPTPDGIITFTDEQVLQDNHDIYIRLKNFLTVISSAETLEVNLLWIAEALGKKPLETIEQTIRNYFMNDFISDHIQAYKKRPIYWMIDSGKHKGMQSLFYLHRYTPHTLGLAVQNQFVPLLGQWRALARVTQEELDGGRLSSVSKKERTKQLKTYHHRMIELESFQDKLDGFARKELVIDLDDGVKFNYQKFKDILTAIKFE